GLAASISSEWKGSGKCYKKVPYEYRNTISGVWGCGSDEYLIANYYGSDDSVSFEIINSNNKIIYTTSNGNLLNITGSSGCIWTAEAALDPTGGQSIVLKELTAYGGLIRTVNLDDIIAITGYVEDMAVDLGDNIFILADSKLYVIDDSGSLLSEITFDGGFPLGLVADAEGNVYANVQSPAGKALYSLDPKTGGTAKLMELGEYTIHNGDEDYYLYLSNHEGLWGLASPDSDTYEPVIIWSECGINFVGLADVFPLDNSSYLCLDSNGAHTLMPAAPDEIVNKASLTLACVSPLLNEAVSCFNAENSNYWMSVRDYSQGGAVSRSDAINLLNTDIIAGKTPDLILFADISISPYTEKGIMADLYDFLDSDPDIDREDFILLDKFETNGKLFYVSHSFSNLELVYGRYSDFGNRYGWTLDEFIEIQNSLKGGQEVFPRVSRAYFLECVMRGYLQEAVDWESGSCDFDNEDFISILNATASINPNIEEVPYNLYYLQTADELINNEHITSLGTLYSVSAIAETEREAGERLSIVGWPTIDGKCGTLLNVDYPIGICEASKNKDGAWAFVKHMLTRSSLGIPICKERLSEEIEGCIVRPERLKEYPPLMSWDDSDRLFELLDAIEVVYEKNDNILNIILEESDAFFGGVRSAKETAGMVNSRVGILMAEQS
ncbi:MAG: extracellular solute-binding protein, partial [Clostridiales bacterium]|nr:extracellular solute-binding protein [Clostridiales bacterium]